MSDRECELPGCECDSGRHRPHEWVDAGLCPGPNHRGPRPDGQPVWCEGHVAKITESLRRLPELAALIPGEYAQRISDAKRDIDGWLGKEPHAPSASTDVDALGEVAMWHHAWTVQAARFLRHTGPVVDTITGVPHLDASITAGNRYLLAQWTEQLFEHPGWDWRFGLSAMNLAGRLEVFLSRDDPDAKLYAPCPVCDGRQLRRRNGASQVDCGRCGNSWPEEHYQLLVRALVAENTPKRRRAGS